MPPACRRLSICAYARTAETVKFYRIKLPLAGDCHKLLQAGELTIRSVTRVDVIAPDAQLSVSTIFHIEPGIEVRRGASVCQRRCQHAAVTHEQQEPIVAGGLHPADRGYGHAIPGRLLHQSPRHGLPPIGGARGDPDDDPAFDPYLPCHWPVDHILHRPGQHRRWLVGDDGKQQGRQWCRGKKDRTVHRLVKGTRELHRLSRQGSGLTGESRLIV